MMKKKYSRIFVTAIVSLSMVLTSFAFVNADSAKVPAEEGTMRAAAAERSVISWSRAKQIFVNEMPDGAVMKYIKLTRDDGRRVYKGKGVKGNRVYSVEINAKTGSITDFESDYEGSRYSASRVGAVSKSAITKKIKEKIPGCYVIYVKLEKDDGRYIYEAEAYRNGYEYDFEYSKRGTLLEFDKDRV